MFNNSWAFKNVGPRVIAHFAPKPTLNIIDVHQHNIKWLLFRKHCDYRVLCLTYNKLFIDNPDT